VSEIAFDFDAPAEIWWPVLINIPADGGVLREHRVEMLLAYEDEPAILADIKPGSASGHFPPADALCTESDRLYHKVRDWKNVRSADGRELPCDDEVKPLLLRRANVRAGVWQAILQMAKGAPAKNSETPRASGPAADGGAHKSRKKAPKKKASKTN